MALNALTVHHLPGFQLFFGDHQRDPTFYLGEKIVACQAVFRIMSLMLPVRKKHLPLSAAFQYHCFGVEVHVGKRRNAQKTNDRHTSQHCFHLGKTDFQGETPPAVPVNVQVVKSMGFPHDEQVWARSNSSENISFSSPQSLHLQVKDLRFLKLAYPGQCCGVESI